MNELNGSREGNSQDDPNTHQRRGLSEDHVARQLTGELRCIGCRYNLHGLSIRSNCPECGVPVRATILGIVDPRAEELVTLTHPRWSAFGLVIWSVGALLSILMVWILRGFGFAHDVYQLDAPVALIQWIGVIGLVVSGIGAISLIRPHMKVTRKGAIRAAMGVGLYAPLVYMYMLLYIEFDSFAPSPVYSASSAIWGRSVFRIMIFLFVAGIVFSLRPNAVNLAIRSVVVRTGRVDRQSMYAVLAALGITALGDLIKIMSTSLGGDLRDWFSVASIVIIALGSVLFTVGMFNICLDTIKLFPILVSRGVGLSDILESNTEKSERLNNQ